MSTYFGGRSEVNLRRTISRVLYADFLSMYPTCFALLGLWRFLIAKEVTWRDATAEVTEFFSTVSAQVLRRPDTWKRMVTIVQLEPEADLLPVGAEYAEGQQATIGLNYFSTEGQRVWHALPDVINAAIQTGKRPRILKAFSFRIRTAAGRAHGAGSDGQSRISRTPR